MADYITRCPLKKTAADLRSGRTDVVEYIDKLCDHISATEAFIHALVPEPGRRERLAKEARALAAQYPRPAQRPALFGVPIGVKDIINVDGFPTRAGSALPPEVFRGPQAGCVTRLRQAGALVVGKAVTAAFAHFSPGPTRNPHNPEHTPGGSSSGSAAGVAAGFFPLALGTQTIGSIIRPAAFCGIAGFKPSFGRIAGDGVLASSPSVDCVGILAQDAEGLALAAALLCDDWQPPRGAKPGRPVLGVPLGPYLAQASEEAREDFQTQVGMFEEAGYSVVRVEALADIDKINRAHKLMVAAEMAVVHERWFAEYGAQYPPVTAQTIREGKKVSRRALEEARAGQETAEEAVRSLMLKRGIDVWVCPAATGPAPQGLASTGDPVMSLPWTYAGLPAAAIPAGLADNGLPLGLQLVARRGEDERLLDWAQKLAAVL